MSTPVLDRTAPTEHPVLDVLAARWSTRAYDAETAIDEAKLSAALEAARWSPSAYNLQPWRFIVARRGTALHAQVVDSLVEFNQLWAANAAVLIVAIAETESEDGKAISHAVYDLGQAVAHFSVQAHNDGLLVHQMSGFDPEVVREFADLAPRFSATTVIAVGELGDAAGLPEGLQQAETAPRVRRAIDETVVLSA
ncbi:nitroreductase family protein [Microbacterium sp. SD291]|uniref:nitroreductase family protein n=1 Tax=Microbacterium sp. SD291 TaxID=2782007 RepID=UPI001A959648|nr:nitroreductase family protein [Microbacterium sp. SD291]MBO0980828.1 nitroreductase family protein [Microbacterium sp. SD291]